MTSPVPTLHDAVVVGAGLAGLSCALTLQRSGCSVLLLEAEEAVGGRVRTDRVDGFLLDRGFQVLLTAYPEAGRAFDYSALDLQALKPGALVWKDGRFHRFADPFRAPFAAIKLALDPIVTLGDKLRVAQLRSHVQRGSLSSLFTHRESTTREFLRRFGFSPRIVESFFAPFFGGVFLEPDLATSSRYFEFLFRMFAIGNVAVPRRGMQALPDQLAARLKPDTLLTGCRVEAIERNRSGFSVRTGDGRSFAAGNVVLAVAGHQIGSLLPAGGRGAATSSAAWNRTVTYYFATEEPPLREPLLMLNGEGLQAGPVNNAVVMSAVSSSYAPADQHLIAASVVGQAPTQLSGEQLGEQQLKEAVRSHLSVWFGGGVGRWRLLKEYTIPHALPLQRHADWQSGNPRIFQADAAQPGIYLAGDFLETASIEGALASGRRAAEALAEDLAREPRA